MQRLKLGAEFRLAGTLVLAMACQAVPWSPAHAAETPATPVSTDPLLLRADALPDAAAGECYAQVRLPERVVTEPVEVVLRDAAHRYEITPAELQTRMQDVVVRDAHTRITAVQPLLEGQPHRVEIEPAGSRWVRDSLDGTIPLTRGEKDDLLDAGILTDQIPVGICLQEYWRPPVMRTESVRVLTREASERLNVIPATFRRAVEHVVLRPAHDRLIEVPAVFGKREESVLMEVARRVWKPGSGPIQRIDHQTGEILCRVDLPAVYETVTREFVEQPAMTTRVNQKGDHFDVDVKRLDTDAQTTRSSLPAEFTNFDKPVVEQPGEFSWQPSTRTDTEALGKPTGRQVCHAPRPAITVDYERQVVTRAGHFERTGIPAEIIRLEVQTLLNPAVADKVAMPAVTETRERVVLREEARMAWQPVLCETNINRDVVRSLQQALMDRGFDPGPVDGVLGKGTQAAIEAFQQQQRLASGGLTLETLEGLGVQLAIVDED